MITDHGTIDVGPFKAEIRERNGVWEFCPLYNHNPSCFASIEMNAEIRMQGRIWTPIPDG